jgi:hypothetical protein
MTDGTSDLRLAAPAAAYGWREWTGLEINHPSTLRQSKSSSQSRSDFTRFNSLLPASGESVPASQPACTAETAASRATVHRYVTADLAMVSLIAVSFEGAVPSAIRGAPDAFRGEGADG